MSDHSSTTPTGGPLPPTDLLKVREMPDIAHLLSSKDVAGQVSLSSRDKIRGLNKAVYRVDELRGEIEPWLTALFQSDHLSVLVGAGLTTAIHLKMADSLPEGFSNRTYAAFNEQIQAEALRSAKATGRGKPNAEDQLSAAIGLRDGLRILLEPDDAPDLPENCSAMIEISERLKADIESALQDLLSGILSSERAILQAAEGGEKDDVVGHLLSFLMSFASRTGTRDRLHLFTTNYDRLLEFGAELAGLRLLDRFVGSLSPIFRSSRLDLDFHYNPPGIRGEPRYLEGVARFTKLHGSLDWTQDATEIRRRPLPFGADDHKIFLGTDANRSLVYPNSSKDRETASYPYVELFRDLAAALCRPNSTIVTYGYSFGDEHINRVIFDMLTIPSTHLVMINFDDTGGRLTKFYTRSKRRQQISMLVGNNLGDLYNLVDYFLPKPAIDRASIRVADLLRARGYKHARTKEKDASDDDEE